MQGARTVLELQRVLGLEATRALPCGCCRASVSWVAGLNGGKVARVMLNGIKFRSFRAFAIYTGLSEKNLRERWKRRDCLQPRNSTAGLRRIRIAKAKRRAAIDPPSMFVARAMPHVWRPH